MRVKWSRTQDVAKTSPRAPVSEAATSRAVQLRRIFADSSEATTAHIELSRWMLAVRTLRPSSQQFLVRADHRRAGGRHGGQHGFAWTLWQARSRAEATVQRRPRRRADDAQASGPQMSLCATVKFYTLRCEAEVDIRHNHANTDGTTTSAAQLRRAVRRSFSLRRTDRPTCKGHCGLFRGAALFTIEMNGEISLTRKLG